MSTPSVRRSGRSGVMRPHDVRAANASAVLRLLLADGPLPRALISRELGLTQGAVTRIVAELTEQGLVREGERVSASAPGRPRVPVEIVSDARFTIGIHIGVEIVHGALIDLHGEAVDSRRVPHLGTVEDVIETCARMITELGASSPHLILGVGAISGGWVEPNTGYIRRHEILGWNDVDLAGALARRTGYPILIEANSRAHALADVIFGDARGHRSFAHIFVGHVVEASLVLDGDVHSGPEGLGGSLANWILDDGDGNAVPARHLISDGQLIARARSLQLVPEVTSFDDLLNAARSGSPHHDKVKALLDERAHRVGRLIAAVVDLVGLSLVIISSGVIALDGAIEEVRRGLDEGRRGLPIPELRTETNSSGILTRAAAAVVMSATLLDGLEKRDDQPANRIDTPALTRSRSGA